MRNTEAREPGALPSDLWSKYNTKARRSQLADSQAKREWMRQNTLLITAKLNRRTDADIIAAIEGSEGSRASRSKELLRKGIEAEKQQ